MTDLYLSRYEIQLESALSELKTVDNLRPFVEINPYRDALAKANQFVGYLPNADDVEPASDMGLDDMFELVRRANEDYQTLQEKKEKLKKKIDELRAKQQVIAPFRPVDCDLHKVLNYRVYNLPVRTHCRGILPQDAEISHGRSKSHLR